MTAGPLLVQAGRPWNAKGFRGVADNLFFNARDVGDTGGVDAGPEFTAIAAINQLHSDAILFAGAPHAAAQQTFNIEAAAYGLGVQRGRSGGGSGWGLGCEASYD